MLDLPPEEHRLQEAFALLRGAGIALRSATHEASQGSEDAVEPIARNVRATIDAYLHALTEARQARLRAPEPTGPEGAD